MKKWTQQDEIFLVEKYNILKPEEIGKIIGRTINAVLLKANKMGLQQKRNLWTEEEDKIIKKYYFDTRKTNLLKLLPKRTWVAIGARASLLKVSRRSLLMDLICGDVKKLLLETPESFYWLGFLLADGHFSKRETLQLAIASTDIDHLKKFGQFISFMGKIHIRGNVSRIQVTDSFYVKKIKEKFDIHHRKTYNPPTIEKFSKYSSDLLIALIIGFIDGDGNIRIPNPKSLSRILRIKLHKSWLPFLKFIEQKLEEFSGIKNIYRPKELYDTYSYWHTTNLQLCRFLKAKTIELNLPVLQRKWDQIDLNAKTKSEKYEPIKNEAIELWKRGWKVEDIAKKLNFNQHSIQNFIWRFKKKNLLIPTKT